jgi:catechol 2,3-dioxygenase-like lactoylglutathione lyase family enzyme
MVQTHGLTHINLAVRDLGRALRFYEQVFGLREYGRGDGLVHTQASGRHDIVQKKSGAGPHFWHNRGSDRSTAEFSRAVLARETGER